jgi:nucleoside-diphosphate-sugar epimerase
VKKILVIGSQGYLGTRLIQYLRDFGHTVGGIDLGTFANCLILNDYTESNIIKKDATEISKKDIYGYDVVINLASNSNDPTSSVDPDKYYEPAIFFSEKIALDCKHLGIKYIFPSSCSVYGAATAGISDENSIPQPITEYSKSKILIEDKLSNLSESNFTPIALRLATVFGFSPRMRFDIVINMFIGMLLTENRIMLNSNGKSWRPHLYIEDAMEAFRCASEWTNNSGKLEVLNVGNNDNNLTIQDSAVSLTKIFTGSQIQYLNPETDNLIFSDNKIINGQDSRDYQVNFNKIYETLPQFNKKTTLIEGAEELTRALKSINFDKKTFLNHKFYRLQYLENLTTSRKLK